MITLRYCLYDFELLLADGEGIWEVPSAFQLEMYHAKGEGEEAIYFCAVEKCEGTGKTGDGMATLGRFVFCHRHARKMLGIIRHELGVERARFFPLVSTIREAAKRDGERPERVDTARAHMASETERLEALQVARRARRKGLTIVKPSEPPIAAAKGTLADQVVPFPGDSVDDEDDEDAELVAMAAMWGELGEDLGGDSGGFFDGLDEADKGETRPSGRAPSTQRRMATLPPRPQVAKCNTAPMEGDPFEGLNAIPEFDPARFTSPRDCFVALGETRAYKELLELHRGDKDSVRACPLHGPKFRRLGWYRAQVLQRGTALGVDWSAPREKKGDETAAPSRPPSEDQLMCTDCRRHFTLLFDRESGHPVHDTGSVNVCGACRKRHKNRTRRDEAERARRERALLESQRAKDKGCGKKGGGGKKKGGRKGGGK